MVLNKKQGVRLASIMVAVALMVVFFVIPVIYVLVVSSFYPVRPWFL